MAICWATGQLDHPLFLHAGHVLGLLALLVGHFQELGPLDLGQLDLPLGLHLRDARQPGLLGGQRLGPLLSLGRGSW